MKRRVWLVFLAVILVASLLAFTACKEEEPPVEEEEEPPVEEEEEEVWEWPKEFKIALLL